MLISKMYRTYLKDNLFMRIILLFSLTTIATIITLSFLMFQVMSRSAVQRQLDIQKEAIQSVSNYIMGKYDSVQIMMRDIYRDSDLTYNTSYFLEHTYDEYVQHRLDRFYTETGAPGDTVRFFRNQVEDDPSIVSLMLYSVEQQHLYAYKNKGLEIIPTNAAQSFVPEAMYVEGSMDVSVPNIWIRKAVDIVDTPMFSVRVPINNKALLRNIGQLLVYFDTKGINDTLSHYEDNLKGSIMVMSSNGDVIFDSSETFYGQKYPYVDQVNTLYESDLEIEGMTITKLTDTHGGFTVISRVTKDELAMTYRGLRNMILMVSMVCILFAIVISSLFISSFAKRIQNIIKFTRKVKNGDMQARIKDIREDELGQISKSFNDMLEDLNLYIDRVYKAEIKQKHTEMTALEARVNPHFLYNTLEVIRMRAISHGAKDVGEMIYSLSVLFKSYVQQKPRYTLKDELEACRLYLELFRIRYKDKFAYQIVCDKVLEDKVVLKMTLQPVIENYILHGMRTDKSDNQISVVVVREKEDLLVIIRDNGKGIQPEKLEHIKEGLMNPDEYSESFGIRSIHERLRLLYGDPYGVDMHSDIGIGTIVSVRFPNLQEEGTNDV
ncbi:sensor histidine kinase [Paenibacillus sp. CMAA1364]